MNLVDKFRHLFERRQRDLDAPVVEDVDPTSVNRANRRRFGWRGPVPGPKPIQVIPRYFRRHAQAPMNLRMAGRKLTRRQRKAIARSYRALAYINTGVALKAPPVTTKWWRRAHPGAVR